MRFVTVLVLIAALKVSRADVHSWGAHIQYYDHHMYERTLIDENTSEPKDYTIFYKYYGAHFKPVAYIEINVDTHSEGYIHLKQDTQEAYFGKKESRQIFDGRVYIKNTRNVKAILKIRGAGMISLPNMGLKKLSTTKSIAYVHVKNSNISTQKRVAQNSIGKRRAGDKLIHFESKSVRNNSRFPSRAFEYSGEEYITYVGFSFDSPTAMAMVNTTFVDEQEFNAVVYDMNSEHFVANMTVYGIKSTFRPSKFEGVI